jgi:proteasome lid subunit RPN8/RPN11
MEAKFFGNSFSPLEVEKIKTEIEANIGRLSEEIALACRGPNADKANFFFKLALLIGKLGQLLDELPVFLKENNRLVFISSSLFLHESFDYLNKGKPESLHFVTGPQLGNKAILDRIIPLLLQTQTFIFARADSVAVRKALIYLSRCEHKLQGCFHIHPGVGIDSTIPSGIDLRLQETLDRGGYGAVSAIFSRDGYIRFYSSLDFEIQIYGKGAEKIDARVYRITEIS